MPSDYRTVKTAGFSEVVEKKSRFLGEAVHVDTLKEAEDYIAAVRKRHYDARHHCFAFVVGIPGTPDEIIRSSDDGEPQGTAGIPMLEVFRRAGVTNLVCVVTRYFGGVLLGTGGLLRAYTQSANDALDIAGIAAVRQWVQLDLPCPYALLERVKTELAACEGVTEGVDYGAEVLLHALLPETAAARFADRVFELSAGKLRPTETGRVFRAAAIR